MGKIYLWWFSLGNNGSKTPLTNTDRKQVVTGVKVTHFCIPSLSCEKKKSYVFSVVKVHFPDNPEGLKLYVWLKKHENEGLSILQFFLKILTWRCMDFGIHGER